MLKHVYHRNILKSTMLTTLSIDKYAELIRPHYFRKFTLHQIIVDSPGYGNSAQLAHVYCFFWVGRYYLVELKCQCGGRQEVVRFLGQHRFNHNNYMLVVKKTENRSFYFSHQLSQLCALKGN